MKIETKILWVLALSEFSSVRMSVHRTQTDALSHLGAAAEQADAWSNSDAADRFYAAVGRKQWETASCIAVGHILASHLRWELQEVSTVDGTRNTLNPVI